VSVNAAEFHSVVVGEIAVIFAVEFEADEDPPPPQAVAKTQPAMAAIKRIRVIVSAKFHSQRMFRERAMRFDSRYSFGAL
jgi:hypothetical protein